MLQDKADLFEAYALPRLINSVIVISLILRAGRNSPPAVNQLNAESPRALWVKTQRSADPV